MSIPVVSRPRHDSEEAVQRRLRSSGYVSLRKVSVARSHDRILLEGEVPSYYLKQMATVLASSAVPDLVIHNQVIVRT
jgi:citrate lyase synthetase